MININIRHLQARRLQQDLAMALRIMRYRKQHRLAPRLIVVGSVLLVPTTSFELAIITP
jgi:hypothetical protein